MPHPQLWQHTEQPLGWFMTHNCPVKYALLECFPLTTWSSCTSDHFIVFLKHLPAKNKHFLWLILKVLDLVSTNCTVQSVLSGTSAHLSLVCQFVIWFVTLTSNVVCHIVASAYVWQCHAPSPSVSFIPFFFAVLCRHLPFHFISPTVLLQSPSIPYWMLFCCRCCLEKFPRNYWTETCFGVSCQRGDGTGLMKSDVMFWQHSCQ